MYIKIMDPTVNAASAPVLPEIVTSPEIQPTPPSSKRKLIFIISIFLSILLIVTTSFGYLFWYVPQIQAKEYLEETGNDFNTIQEKLNAYHGNFDPLSKSFAKSKTAFYEVTKNGSYLEIVNDTKQDISDINATLQLIKEAKQTKASLQVPEDLKQLDGYLDNYYEQTEKGLQLLLNFENLQTEIIEAMGKELVKEGLKLEFLLKSPHPRQEMVNYFINLSLLANDSISMYKNITPPQDENLKTYYNTMLDNDIDLATSAADIAQEISKSSPESDRIAYEKIYQYSDRTAAKDLIVRQSAKNFSSNSPINKLFQESALIESQIINEFNKLKEKYGLKNDQNSFNNEASSSASLEASQSASFIPSPIPSLNASSSAESTNSAKN